MKKKLSAILLTLCLLFSLCPPFAFAEDGHTADNESGNITISTLAGLRQFAEAVNGGETFRGKTVTLIADIDLKNEEWTPIGMEDKPFLGTFDGGSHTVSNLRIDNPELENAGLFGVLKEPGKIMNLTVRNAAVAAKAQAGGLIGSAFTGSLVNCHVTGKIQITANYKAGGLAGEGYASMTNCTVKGAEGSTVTGIYLEKDLEGDNVGGLVGFRGEGNGITTSGCSVENLTITGTRKVGGLIGSAFGNNQITNCSVLNCTVATNATAEYAHQKSSTMGIGGLVGNYTNSGYTNGTLTGSVVENITLVNGNEGAEAYACMNYLVGNFRNARPSDSVEKDITVENNTISGINTGSSNPTNVDKNTLLTKAEEPAPLAAGSEATAASITRGGEIYYFTSLSCAIAVVEDQETITVYQSDLEATVPDDKNFIIKAEGEDVSIPTLKDESGNDIEVGKDGQVGNKKPSAVSTDSGRVLGYRLPMIDRYTPGLSNFLSGTTQPLTVNGVYQFRITSLGGSVPSMTAGNGFRVELASQEGSDYFFKLYAPASGTSCLVFVNGVFLLAATAA